MSDAVSEELRQRLSQIGRRGGLAGRGTPKEHGDPGFYQRVGRKGAEARWKTTPEEREARKCQRAAERARAQLAREEREARERQENADRERRQAAAFEQQRERELQKEEARARKQAARAERETRKGIDVFRKPPSAPRPKPELCERPGCTHKATVVDHCHRTGAFRGWLCKACNTGLGMLGDTIEDVEQLRQYLLNASTG